MSRYSPTVLPEPNTSFADALSGLTRGYDYAQQLRERRRQNELADVTAENELRNQGISRDPRTQAGRLGRMGEEAVRALPNVNLDFDPGLGVQPAPRATMADHLQRILRQNAPRPGDEELAAQERARLPSSETTFAPRPVAPSPTVSTTLTPSTRPQRVSLGHGYSFDPEQGPEARAEATYQRRRQETLADYLGRQLPIWRQREQMEQGKESAALERVQAQQAGATGRTTLQQAGAGARVGQQQAGATARSTAVRRPTGGTGEREDARRRAEEARRRAELRAEEASALRSLTSLIYSDPRAETSAADHGDWVSELADARARVARARTALDLSGRAGTKTVQQWVDEVAADPQWVTKTDQEIRAEARRRSRAAATPRR